MKLSMAPHELKQYVSRQLDHFFSDGCAWQGSDVDCAWDAALQRIEYCFKHIKMPYYHDAEHVSFHHMHSDHYCALLYFLSNSLWEKSQNKPLCDKLLCLNKALNSVFISYKCKLPDIFLFCHPVASVIGNAEFSDFLVIYQNVTINTGYPIDLLGQNPSPRLGKGVFLAAGSKIIGSNRIGDFSSVGVNTCVFKTDVPDNSIAFTDADGKFNIKENKNDCIAQTFFNVDIRRA